MAALCISVLPSSVYPPFHVCSKPKHSTTVYSIKTQITTKTPTFLPQTSVMADADQDAEVGDPRPPPSEGPPGVEQPETETTESEARDETETTESEARDGTEAEPKADSEVKADPESTAKMGTESGTETKTETELETKAETTVEAKNKGKGNNISFIYLQTLLL